MNYTDSEPLWRQADPELVCEACGESGYQIEEADRRLSDGAIDDTTRHCRHCGLRTPITVERSEHWHQLDDECFDHNLDRCREGYEDRNQ